MLQEVFTCTREEDSIRCEDSPMFYNLNTNFGHKEDEPVEAEEEEVQEEEQPVPEQILPVEPEGREFQPRVIPLQQREMRRKARN